MHEFHELRPGPVQGLPACLRIPLGRGACGTAAQARQTVMVDDVDQFPGHIACDSPDLKRFDVADAQGPEKLVQELLQLTTWPASF